MDLFNENSFNEGNFTKVYCLGIPYYSIVHRDLTNSFGNACNNFSFFKIAYTSFVVHCFARSRLLKSYTKILFNFIFQTIL